MASYNGMRAKPPLFTLFVDNIPDKLDQSWLVTTFSKFGIVKDAFIPAKKSRRGSRFGFVRFDCSVSAGVAVHRANGMRIWNYKLHVKMASFDQENKKNGTWKLIDATRTREDSQKNPMEYRKGEGRSYAQVTRGVTSYGVHDNIDSIQINQTGNGWLYRSVVAKMRRLLSTDELIKKFRMEKVLDVQIKAMGGRFVIITFLDTEARDMIIKESWLLNWFEEIKPWNEDQAKDERFAWISCFGMPLNAWVMPTFRDIGNKWGHFIKVDEYTLKGMSYERGRILIATELVHKIQGRIELVIGGKRFSVRVEEEETFRTVESSKNPNDQVLMSKEEDDDMDSNNVDVERQEEDLANNNDLLEDKEEEDHVDALTAGNLQEKSNNQVSLGGFVSIVEESPIHAYDGLEIPKMVEELKGEIPIDDDPFMVPDSIGNRSDDLLSNCDSMVGDSKEDIDLFEDIAAARQLDNTMEYVEVVADSEVGANRKSDVSASQLSLLHQVEDYDDGIPLVQLEANRFSPVKAALKGIKRKKKRKTIDEILGFSKVNPGNYKGGRNKQKCVVFRSAVAAAALSASVSADGITNRNKILLNEAQAIWEMNKASGIGYEGDEDEVISKLVEMRMQDIERANCQL